MRHQCTECGSTETLTARSGGEWCTRCKMCGATTHPRDRYVEARIDGLSVARFETVRRAERLFGPIARRSPAFAKGAT